MLKVLVQFRDKYDETRVFYPGDLIEVENKQREKDLIERGMVTEAIPFVLKERIESEAGSMSENNHDGEYQEKFQEGETNFSDLTVKEIKALLDEKGVEYDAKAKKEELIELLKGVE